MGYFDIGPKQAEALQDIACISTSDFRELVSKLSDSDRPSIRASNLLNVVKELTSDEKFSVALCTQLISLATFRRVKGRGTKEVVDSLLEGMKVAEFSEEIRSWFSEVREDFSRLLDCESVKLPAKALHLSSDFQQIFASANVVTDVRPVFDGERTTVAGAIVTQSLRIQFVGSGGQSGEQEVSLALDLDDIEKLIAELEKAKQKAVCAKDRFSDTFGEDIFVTGEETYGFS